MSDFVNMFDMPGQKFEINFVKTGYLNPLTEHLFVTGKSGCLHEDTLIQTNKGIVPIKSAKGKIKCFDFNKQNIEWSDFIKIKSGLKPLLEIITEKGTILATEEHLFFKKVDERILEIKAMNLRCGDYILGYCSEKCDHIKIIKDILPVGVYETYDLIVPDYNNFFLANGILTHNSGKSSYSEFVLTRLMKRGYKVIDVYDSGRFENALYCLPEQDPYLIKKMDVLSNGVLKPESFEMEYIMICGRDLQYNPVLPANVKVMAFDEKDFTINDLWHFLGRSETLEGNLAAMENRFGDKLTLKEIYELVQFNKFRGQTVSFKLNNFTKSMIIRNLNRWLNSGMFSPALPKINFKELCADTKTVTCFSTFLLSTEEEERLAYGLIIKKINEMKRKRKVTNKIAVYCREISVFFSEDWKLAKTSILDILRQGRDREITLIADGQRVLDIPSKWRRQFGTIVQLRTDYADAEKLLEFQGGIPKYILFKLSTMKRGEGIIATGSEWFYPFYGIPSPILHKRAGMDVLEILKEKFGEKDYAPELKNILKLVVDSVAEVEEQVEQVEQNAKPKRGFR